MAWRMRVHSFCSRSGVSVDQSVTRTTGSPARSSSCSSKCSTTGICEARDRFRVTKAGSWPAAVSLITEEPRAREREEGPSPGRGEAYGACEQDLPESEILPPLATQIKHEAVLAVEAQRRLKGSRRRRGGCNGRAVAKYGRAVTEEGAAVEAVARELRGDCEERSRSDLALRWAVGQEVGGLRSPSSLWSYGRMQQHSSDALLRDRLVCRVPTHPSSGSSSPPECRLRARAKAFLLRPRGTDVANRTPVGVVCRCASGEMFGAK